MKNLNIKTTVGSGKNKGNNKIVIEGDFSIGNLQKLQEICINTIEDCTKITFEAKNIEGFDFASCQFLISLYKTAQNKEKVIVFNIEFPQEYKVFIKNSGLSGHPVFAGLIN